jgi:hypothetical protein
MIQCTSCGIILTYYYEFSGRKYCKEHYEEHIEREREARAYLIIQSWDDVMKIPDDSFIEILQSYIINCSKCGRSLPRLDVFHWCINSFTEIKK